MPKSLVAALRAAVIPTLALPVALAAFGAAMTGAGPPPQTMATALIFVAAAVAACWSHVLARWREQGRDDDDDQWRRDHDNPDPRWPNGGSGGPAIDWTAFERGFDAYVRECAARRDDRVLVESR